MLKFHTCLISCLCCHKIYLKYPPLTCIRARRCVLYVCRSLIAGRVLHFSTGQCSHEYATLSDFWSRQHHCSYQQIKHPRHQPSGVHYMWRYRIACLPVMCVQNVNELKQRLLDVCTAWNRISLTVQLTLSLVWNFNMLRFCCNLCTFSNVCISHGSVATDSRCGGNFLIHV